MNLRFVWAICVAGLSFIGISSVKAQDYHQLNINDFKGKPQTTTGNIAYTNCMVNFSYLPAYTRGYYHLTFDIKMKMNKDLSWIDRSKITNNGLLAEVLKHEQGHYIFAYLMQQELQRTLSSMRFGSNYEQQVNAVYCNIIKKYAQLNKDYDDDTNHMLNRKQQGSWDLYLKSQLVQYNNMTLADQ